MKFRPTNRFEKEGDDDSYEHANNGREKDPFNNAEENCRLRASFW